MKKSLLTKVALPLALGASLSGCAFQELHIRYVIDKKYNEWIKDNPEKNPNEIYSESKISYDSELK